MPIRTEQNLTRSVGTHFTRYNPPARHTTESTSITHHREWRYRLDKMAVCSLKEPSIITSTPTKSVSKATPSLCFSNKKMPQNNAQIAPLS